MSSLPHRSPPAAGVGGAPAVSERQIAALMSVVAATLAAMSFLHLSGTLGGGTDAGVAEAVICVALGLGAGGLLRGWPRAQTVALAATGFAIVGFIIGLGITANGGNAIDVAYHASVLPILLLTLIDLLRIRARATHRAVRTLRSNSEAS